MPELPDVENFKRYFNRTSLNKIIKQVEVKNKKVMQVDEETLKEAVRYHEFTETKRHGKYLFARLNKKWIMFHFGMTGDFKYFKNRSEDPEHDRLMFTFSNGYHLAFVNQRLLGKVDLVENVEEFIEKKNLGPDALEITFEEFKEIFDRKKYVKSTLMDQKLVSGVGNIYADEILFQSKVHPKTKSNTLSDKKLKKMYNTMRRVFRISIKHNAKMDELPRGYIISRREKGEKCPKCKGKIKRVKISGRSSYICPKCQKT